VSSVLFVIALFGLTDFHSHYNQLDAKRSLALFLMMSHKSTATLPRIFSFQNFL